MLSAPDSREDRRRKQPHKELTASDATRAIHSTRDVCVAVLFQGVRDDFSVHQGHVGRMQFINTFRGISLNQRVHDAAESGVNVYLPFEACLVVPAAPVVEAPAPATTRQSTQHISLRDSSEDQARLGEAFALKHHLAPSESSRVNNALGCPIPV
jgi:hypothetical protein